MAYEKGIAETFGFVTLLATDHLTPTVPTTPVATISKDGGGFNPCDNAVTSVASGFCTLLLSATEKNADVICVRITSDNCDPVMLPIRTEDGWTAAKAAAITEARLAELDAANLPTDIAAIPTTPMRGTDNAALATVCTEARLAELGAANLPADVDTLIARLTAARAGYLDELAAANLPADVDTLKSRITANLFTGITKLANWLRLLARSDAAITTDAATELAEINADQGSGAGDFAATTDSEEAIRDRGDAAWTTSGSGAATITEATLDVNSVAIGAVTAGGVAVSGARVCVYADADTGTETPLYEDTTDGDGGFSIPVPTGATYRVLPIYQGYTYTVKRVTV